MADTINIVYLHGLASSPGSKKAGDFRTRLAPYDHVNYLVPDLNVPDFAHLTLTAMIERTAQIVRECPEGPVFLVGSSMGGLTAVHFMHQHRSGDASRVKGLVLLAPAFDFMANRDSSLGEAGIRAWRESGWLTVHNYATGTDARIHYGLVEDAQQYDSYAVEIDAPILIYHGLHDESVDYRQSVRFAESRTNVTLHLVDSDHQLLDQTNAIWTAMQAFFGL
jgi:uncharacterized protein